MYTKQGLSRFFAPSRAQTLGKIDDCLMCRAGIEDEIHFLVKCIFHQHLSSAILRGVKMPQIANFGHFDPPEMADLFETMTNA